VLDYPAIPQQAHVRSSVKFPPLPPVTSTALPSRASVGIRWLLQPHVPPTPYSRHRILTIFMAVWLFGLGRHLLSYSSPFLWITRLSAICRIAAFNPLPPALNAEALVLLWGWLQQSVMCTAHYSTKKSVTPIHRQWKSVNRNSQLYGVLVCRYPLYTTTNSGERTVTLYRGL
jgi:hypothetical protein